MGTQERKFHPHPAPPKRKNEHALVCMFSSFIGCMHILFLDMVATIPTANTPSTKQAYLLKLSSGWNFCCSLNAEPLKTCCTKGQRGVQIHPTAPFTTHMEQLWLKQFWQGQ